LVPADRLGPGAQSGQRDIISEHFSSDENEETSQRVTVLAEIPGLLRELGADPTDVLSRAGLEPDALDTVENRISFLAGGRLLYECVVKTGCRHFSLLLGQRNRLSHLGLLGRLVRHAPTLGDAIRIFAVYQHLNSQGMAKFLVEKDDMAILGNIIYQKGTEHVDQIYDIDAAATLSIIRELCGTQWKPERVLFSHAKPLDPGPYRRFFQAPCRFDCEQTALIFPAVMLERRLMDADPRQFRSLEAQAQARADFSLVFRLRRTLGTLLLARAASGDEVAKLLSMHHRTLNRRLRAEGTTFQKVLDEVRFEAACQLLDTASISITEIAVALGYTEPSAFTRAFRRWSGTTPLERRRRSQGVRGPDSTADPGSMTPN
jgi:AraC-like DNA-binding protein